MSGGIRKPSISLSTRRHVLGHCVWGTWGVMIHKRHTVPAVTGLAGYWQGMVSLA